MKTKILKRACALLAAAVMLMFCTVSAFAEETYEQSGSYSNQHVYLYDETKTIKGAYVFNVAAKMNSVYSSSKCCMGLFFGAKERSMDDIAALAKEGAEDMYLKSGSEGAFFVYLDYDGVGDYNDYIYCAGKALYYLPNGEDGTFDAIGDTLYHVRNTRKDNPSYDAKTNMIIKAVYLCDTIIHYVNNPPELTSESADTYDDSYESTYSNPDSYILDSSYYSSQKSTSQNNGSSKTYSKSCVSFFDEGGMFTDAQAKQVLQRFEGTAQEIQFNMVLYAAVKSRSDSSVENLTRSNASMAFPESPFTGTVCLYIDLDGYSNAYDYMFCYNDAFLYYTNGDDGTEDRIKKILHAMQSYFPAGGQKIVIDDIIKGLDEYCSQLIYYKSQGLVNGIYYTDPVTGEYVYASGGKIVHSRNRPYTYWWAGLLIGIAVGVIAAIITKISVQKHYKFKSSASASLYTSQEKIYMRNSQDIFIGSHVSKVRIQSSSGGHGGHGGGGGHVGGGGGGSHR